MTEPIRLRASSLAELFDCPARWKAKHIDGITLPRSDWATIGTAVHEATAVFDQGRVDCDPFRVDDVLGVAVDEIHRPTEDQRWLDLRPKEAERLAIMGITRYCLDVSPQFEFATVEQKLEAVEIDMGDGIVFRLTGKLDRTYLDFHHRRGIADLKTGKQAVVRGEVPTPRAGAQLGEYELLEMLGSRQTGAEYLLPARILGVNTKTGEVGTGTIQAPHRMLLGNPDRGEPGLLEMAARIIKSESWFGNPQSMLCSERYCPAWSGCRWRFRADESNHHL